MNTRSIQAYDIPNRGRDYDLNMDLMHPLRKKMASIALELLDFNTQEKLKVLDLGIGTGYFTSRFLTKFPKAHIIGIDGAPAMINIARERFLKRNNQIQLIVSDFREIENVIDKTLKFDVIYSSYSLHHLNYEEKLKTVKFIHTILKDGGWFLNADLICSKFKCIDDRYQDLRILGILERSKGIKFQFSDYKKIKSYLINLEIKEGDQPLTLLEDLNLIKLAGFNKSEAFWCEYREVIMGGIK